MTTFLIGFAAVAALVAGDVMNILRPGKRLPKAVTVTAAAALLLIVLSIAARLVWLL
jgi:hypothetical protein